MLRQSPQPFWAPTLLGFRKIVYPTTWDSVFDFLFEVGCCSTWVNTEWCKFPLWHKFVSNLLDKSFLIWSIKQCLKEVCENSNNSLPLLSDFFLMHERIKNDLPPTVRDMLMLFILKWAVQNNDEMLWFILYYGMTLYVILWHHWYSCSYTQEGQVGRI